MNGLRASTVLLSMALHGALIGWMLHVPMVGKESFEAGSGSDQMTVENAISIEGPLMVGDAVETLQAQEIAPTEMVQAVAPVEEVKPDELTEVIKTTAVDQEHIVAATEPEPVKPAEPPPTQVAALALPEQTAVDTQASSGKAKAGGDPTLLAQYKAKIIKAVQKSAVRPSGSASGMVWIRFSLAKSGTILSREVATSSGIQYLDAAAIKSIDRTTFPPLPDGVSEPLTYSMPYEYK